MPKPSPTSIPVLITDEQAEDFLDQDLSTLDVSQFKPTHFGAQPKPVQPIKRRPRP